MALSKPRLTPQMGADAVVRDLEVPVAANAVIYQGALVVLEGGYATAGKTATGLVAIGRAEETVDNTGGAAGAKAVRVRRGTFKFKNDGTDPVGQASLGKTCYIVDDETVAATDGTATRSAAGKVLGVEADGVWVEIL